MIRRFIYAVVAGSVIATSSAAAPQSDAEIRKAIIQASINSYSGSCPCPYNAMRNGAACGGRSAWSKPGGYAPKCYPSDVSKEEVEAHRRSGF
jgi:hypothetical protein